MTRNIRTDAGLVALRVALGLYLLLAGVGMYRADTRAIAHSFGDGPDR